VIKKLEKVKQFNLEFEISRSFWILTFDLVKNYLHQMILNETSSCTRSQCLNLSIWVDFKLKADTKFHKWYNFTLKLFFHHIYTIQSTNYCIPIMTQISPSFLPKVWKNRFTLSFRYFMLYWIITIPQIFPNCVYKFSVYPTSHFSNQLIYWFRILPNLLNNYFYESFYENFE